MRAWPFLLYPQPTKLHPFCNLISHSSSLPSLLSYPLFSIPPSSPALTLFFSHPKYRCTRPGYVRRFVWASSFLAYERYKFLLDISAFSSFFLSTFPFFVHLSLVLYLCSLPLSPSPSSPFSPSFSNRLLLQERNIDCSQVHAGVLDFLSGDAPKDEFPREIRWFESDVQFVLAES